jgi:hypothetical protein
LEPTHQANYGNDKQSAIDGTIESLIIIGIIEMYVGMMQVGGIYASRRLYKLKRQAQEAGDAPQYEEERHSFQEKVVIGWSIFTGLIAIFWQGEFAVFNQLIKVTEHESAKPASEEAQGLWFLAGWKMYAKADGRYTSGDSFIVATETFSAICMGPGFLLVAWAVYQHAAYRDVLLVVMCVLHTYSYVLYFSTAIHDRFVHCAPRDDLLYFWVLFVFLNAARFLFALPVLYYAMRNIIRVYTSHNERLRRLRRRRGDDEAHFMPLVLEEGGFLMDDLDDDDDTPPAAGNDQASGRRSPDRSGGGRGSAGAHGRRFGDRTGSGLSSASSGGSGGDEFLDASEGNFNGGAGWRAEAKGGASYEHEIDLADVKMEEEEEGVEIGMISEGAGHGGHKDGRARRSSSIVAMAAAGMAPIQADDMVDAFERHSISPDGENRSRDLTAGNLVHLEQSHLPPV